MFGAEVSHPGFVGVCECLLVFVGVAIMSGLWWMVEFDLLKLHLWSNVSFLKSRVKWSTSCVQLACGGVAIKPSPRHHNS